jgi:hypothetical protein
MKYRIGEVQDVKDGRDFHFGFNILDAHGAPIVMFSCLDRADAAKARGLSNKQSPPEIMSPTCFRNVDRPRFHVPWPLWRGSPERRRVRQRAEQPREPGAPARDVTMLRGAGSLLASTSRTSPASRTAAHLLTATSPVV